MKANEARQRAEAANTGELPEVYDAIRKFSDLGDYDMHIYFRLRDEQIAELKAKGFNVEDVSKGNEICIRISW